MTGVETSVDAPNVPRYLEGFRTAYTSFHHSEPDLARKILQDGASKREGIGIFEFKERSLVSFIPVLLMPFVPLVTTPFIRPFTWARLLWTYLIAVVPLILCWDRMVSNLRTYSPENSKQLTEEIKSDHYTWEIGKVRSFGACRITYLLGYST